MVWPAKRAAFLGKTATQAATLFVATTKWVSAGAPLRTDEEIRGLFAICQGCEFFKATGDDAGECSKCGCNCKAKGLMNKLAMSTEKCPVGKW